MMKLDESDLQDSESASAGFPFAQHERWFLLRRLVTRKYFGPASQLRGRLVYVTSQVLLDEKIAIPEHEIACKVLGRRESFNPNDDNIVRVQAGHLRKKLDQYFSSEGREEPYVLVIPRGTYVPHFVTRQSTVIPELTLPDAGHGADVSRSDSTATASISTNDVAASVFPEVPDSDRGSSTAAPSPEQPQNPRWTSRLFGASGWFWLLVAFSLGVAAAVYRDQSGSGLHPVIGAKELPRNFIEQRIFVAGAPLSIVATDSSLVLLQNTLHTDIPVSDYIGGQYPSNILARSANPEQRAALENAM